MPIKITKNSPQIPQIPQTLCEMKPHQLAIAHQCMELENEYFNYIQDKNKKDKVIDIQEFQTNTQQKQKQPFGVLGTIVGSGKTLCIIALCLLDKFKRNKSNDRIFSQNTSLSSIIVVPSHLYYQWVEAFQIYVGDSLTVEMFDDYDSILKLYADKSEIIKKADVYLVSSLFYQTVASTLNTMKLAFKRVVFDEIDSIESFVHTTLPAGYTWFVSGSLKEELEKNMEFKFGPNSLSCKELLSNFIECDEQFIVENFNILPYDFKSITCDNPVIDVLKTVLEPDVLRCINACDPETALIKLGQQAEANIQNDKEFANIVLRNWSSSVEQLTNYTKDLQTHLNSVFKPEQKAKLSKELEVRQKELDTTKNKHDTLKKNMETVKAHSDRPKLVTLSNLIVRNKGKKILLYAEYPRVFNDITKFLQDYGIGYVDFEGGNNELMNKAIHQFKTDNNINVFLTHSTLFSCGMNLENTTHTIFLHRVRPEVQKQVIGRGQRPGRTCSLEVIELLYKNEKNLK